MSTNSKLRSSWVLVAIVLVIAAETRFLGLGLQSLWFDEAYSVFLAQTPLPGILVFLHGADTHPPLYYIVLRGWMHLFGSGESAVRSLSALAGFITVPVLFVFAGGMVAREVALVAAALLAGSGFAVEAAREARMYPLLGLLALVSWTALRAAAREGKTWAWAGYTLSAALMLYTHYFGFLVLGSQGLYLLPRACRDRRLLLSAGLAMVVAVALFLPWAPAFVAQATSGRGWPTFRMPVGVTEILDLLGLYGFGGELLGMGGYFHRGVLPLWQASLMVVPIAALLAAGWYALRGERAWCLLCYWVGPIAIALLVSTRYNIFYGRYFSFLVPPVALLAAAGVDLAARRLVRLRPFRRPGPSAVMAGLVALIVLVNAPVLNGYRWHRAGDYDWRGAAELVSQNAGADDYLLFVPGYARIPFEYYFRGRQARYELNPVEIYAMAHTSPPRRSPVDRTWAKHLAEGHPTVWIVATTPVTAKAYVRLRDLLGDSFKPGRQWDFNDVYVIAVSSRLFSTRAKRP